MNIFDYGKSHEGLSGTYDLKFEYDERISEAIVVVNAIQMALAGEMLMSKEPGQTSLDINERVEREVCDDILEELALIDISKKDIEDNPDEAHRMERKPVCISNRTIETVESIYKALSYFIERTPDDMRKYMLDPHGPGRSFIRNKEASVAERMIRIIEAEVPEAAVPIGPARGTLGFS